MSWAATANLLQPTEVAAIEGTHGAAWDLAFDTSSRALFDQSRILLLAIGVPLYPGDPQNAFEKDYTTRVGPSLFCAILFLKDPHGRPVEFVRELTKSAFMTGRNFFGGKRFVHEHANSAKAETKVPVNRVQNREILVVCSFDC